MFISLVITKNNGKLKKFSLFLAVGLVLVGGFAFSIPKAQAAAVNTATTTNVTPSTYQYTTFKGVPVYRLHITNAGNATDTLLSLAMDPYTGDTVNDTLITLHFYDDANNNGIVDQGDVNLGGSAAFASDNTKKIFTFDSPLTIPVGVTSILVTADGGPAVGDTGIFHLQIDLGTDILMGTVAISNTGDFPLVNTSPLTVSNTAPSLSITNGASDPGPKTATSSATGVVIKQLSITAGATSDSIVSLAITPNGTENDTNVSSTKFYIDSGTIPGAIDAGDILLVKTPATYSTNNGKEIFTFLGPIQIAGATTTNILYTYDLGADVTAGNTLTARLVDATDAVTGSGIVVSPNSSTVSATTTIAGTTHLIFDQGPTNTVYGSAISPAITVRILDGSNALISAATNTVTLAIDTNPGGGTLSGTVTKAAVGGIATFDDLKINKVGTGYTLITSSTGLTSTTSVTFNIIQKNLTVTATGIDKTYDGTTAASVTLSTSTDVISGDDVVATSTSATFATSSVGNGILVTVATISISGADSANYNLFSPTASTTADINPKNLTITGAVADSRTYNASTTATVDFSSSSLVTVEAGDIVTIDSSGYVANFADKTATPGKTVTVTGVVLGGADKNNYTVSQPTGLTATITQKNLTVAATGIDKTYDGTTATSVTLSTSTDVTSGDVVIATSTSAIFLTKTVGSAKTVNVTGISISGADFANYNLLSTTASTTASIIQKNLTGSITANNKVHDGNTTATILDRTLNGVLGSDDVSYAGGTATFDNADVGTGKTVTATSLSLIGTDIGNYTVNSTATTIANITASGDGGGGGYFNPYHYPYTVTINGGATSTASINVTLTLTSIAGMDQMWVSNDYNFATSSGTGWIPFQATYPWTLTLGLGNKTVSVRFGNASTTTPAGTATASITVVGGGVSGTSALTNAQLQALLNQLIIQLQALIAKAQAAGIQLPPGTVVSSFVHDLKLGATHDDAKALQAYLNGHGFLVSLSGSGSKGHETNYFGPATMKTLVAFQKSVGISPAVGYFGPLTRNYINSHP